MYDLEIRVRKAYLMGAARFSFVSAFVRHDFFQLRSTSAASCSVFGLLFNSIQFNFYYLSCHGQTIFESVTQAETDAIGRKCCSVRFILMIRMKVQILLEPELIIGGFINR